jgi:hypothetical protein
MFRSARDHHQETEQKKTYNPISHFCTQLTWCKSVKYLKCRHFFVDLLYECAGSWCTVSWMQTTYLKNVSTFLNYSTKECLRWNYCAVLRHVNCVDKVTNLVLWGIALVWFPDDASLRIEMFRNVQCDIIIQISKENFFVYCWSDVAN